MLLSCCKVCSRCFREGSCYSWFPGILSLFVAFIVMGLLIYGVLYIKWGTRDLFKRKLIVIYNPWVHTLAISIENFFGKKDLLTIILIFTSVFEALA